MIRINKIFTLLSIILLSSCSNIVLESSAGEKAGLLPKVTNACYKINALINEYDNDFNKIKSAVINTRISSIWKAKYHLVGDHCQVWAWGKNRHTYSCSNTVPNKETADYYFQSAKHTAKSCLGIDWVLKESARKNDNGYKIEFNNINSDLMLAIHAVPTANLFKSEWTVYYYIGSVSQAK